MTSAGGTALLADRPSVGAFETSDPASRDTDRQLAIFTRSALVLIIFGQRLALPLGGSSQVSLMLPVLILLVGVAWKRKLLVVRRLSSQLYLAAIVLCSATVFLHMVSNRVPSKLSYLYLVLTYLPFLLKVRHGTKRDYAKFLDTFAALMSVVAVLGIVQFLVQLVGIHWVDYLGDVVPKKFLLQGFSTGAPLYYLSPIHRTNGIFCLEPSFYSQFLAIAIVGRLWLGRRGPRTGLLIVAIVPAVAGTGLIMIGVGAAALLFTPQRRLIMRFVPWAIVVGIAVAFSPLSSAFGRRATEGSSANSSTSFRFIQPYTTFLPGWGRHISSILLGYGPGAADELARSISGSFVAPVIPKLLYEYGAFAGLAFFVFAIASLSVHAPSRPLAATMIVSYLLLSGGLLTTVTVYSAYMFTALWSGARGDATDDPLPVVDAMPA